jgi:hypothetical protein
LPTFGSREALGLLRARNDDTPFIVVTGASLPEVAAQLMSDGADDYVLKNEMNRLGAVALKALKKRAKLIGLPGEYPGFWHPFSAAIRLPMCGFQTGIAVAAGCRSHRVEIACL